MISSFYIICIDYKMCIPFSPAALITESPAPKERFPGGKTKIKIIDFDTIQPLSKAGHIVNLGFFQWSFLVPLIGGRYHIIPQLAVYTTYIPFIYCLLGLPPIKGTRNSY